MSEIGHTVPLLSLLNVSIKTPQLIGIVVGCLVFTITIITVFALLYASGSLSKLAEELSNTHPTSKQNSTKIVSGIPFSSEPELYEELLFARTKLPTMPSISLLLGRVVNIKTYDQSALGELLQISDGRAVFHESSFDPARLTGWLDTERCTPTRSIVDLLQCDPEKKTHLCIVDKELNKIVGMLSLVDNCPRNLSIRIDNVWITPAFQGQKRAHEAVLLVLQWLHTSGYRRITAEVEERHIIGRKFFERCGFQCEAVLRKHKVLHNRNSNTALYTVLNSDFVEVERRLKLFLGIPLTAPMQKIAAIDGASAAVEAEAVARQGGVTGVAGSSAGSSSKKNAKKGLKRKSKDNRINIVW